VQITFDHFDKDHSGTLEMRELAAALRHLGMGYSSGARYDTIARWLKPGRHLSQPAKLVPVCPFLMRRGDDCDHEPF
jgi:hypothetical protein